MPVVALQAAVLWLLAQFAPGTEPPLEWGGPSAHVAVEVVEEPVQGATRYAYTLRYLAASGLWPPIVRFDVGARSFAGGAELETAPLAIESPPGWHAVLVPDRSRPQAWQVSWTCARGDWTACLEHQVKAGQVRSGFRITVPPGTGGYRDASYVVAVDPERGLGLPYGLTGKVRRRSK